VYESLVKERFAPITVESLPLFARYDENTLLYESSAAVSVTWAAAFNAVYKIIGGYLCSAWFYQNGAVYFLVQHPPEKTGNVGSVSIGVRGDAVEHKCSVPFLVERLYELVCGAGGLSALSIWAVEERFLSEYEAANFADAKFAGAKFDITIEAGEDYNEYVYKATDLAELSGAQNQDKRRHLKKCADRTAVLTPITRENIQVCLEIEDNWCREQDCAACRAFSGCEKQSLQTMCAIFDGRVYKGFYLYVDEEVAGFVIFEQRGENAFFYFAKANISNFNVCLYYMTVKDHISGELNIGMDMGKAGLRVFKSHLGMYTMRRKYLCVYKRTNDDGIAG
jgi:hypothetical protein